MSPKVTVQCHCGNQLSIPYGARDRCPCGRTWNTAQIPRADYDAVVATAKRFRRNEAGFALVALGLAAALFLVGRSAPLLVSAPVFVLVWLRWFRPWWRARKRDRLRDLPVWDLSPETGPARGA